jgi:hypothetical protein
MPGVVDKFISNIHVSSLSPPKISEFMETKATIHYLYINFIIMVVETERTKYQPVDNASDLFRIVHQYSTSKWLSDGHIFNYNCTNTNLIFLWMSNIYIRFTLSNITLSVSI